MAREKAAKGSPENSIQVPPRAKKFLIYSAIAVLLVLLAELRPVPIKTVEDSEQFSCLTRLRLTAERIWKVRRDYQLRRLDPPDLPESVEELVPGFLETVPRCPRTGLEYDFIPDPLGTFKIECRGQGHVFEDRPTGLSFDSKWVSFPVNHVDRNEFRVRTAPDPRENRRGVSIHFLAVLLALLVLSFAAAREHRNERKSRESPDKVGL